MNDPRTVAVVGLGLVGGSIARDLAAAGVRVLAHDRDQGALADARREGAVHVALPDDLAGIEAAEVVVVAVPVDAAPAILRALRDAAPAARLVTDVGSTKRSAVRAATEAGIGPRFVGAHPMAGDHRSGWSASRRGLFAGARVYLCPAPDASTDAVRLAERFWRLLGACPERADAAEHDALLAWSSHLPHVASATLATVLAEAGVPRARLGPGGRDATRLAGSAPALWTAIVRDNAEAMVDALERMERALAAVRAAIERDDAAAVAARFAEAREWFDAG